MNWIIGHRILREQDGSTVILYLDQYLTEFSSEFLQVAETQVDTNIEESAVKYIQRKLPNIKVKTVKIMLGTLLLATLSLGGLAGLNSYGFNPPTVNAQAEMIHIVKPGDTLFRIANLYNSSVAAIKAVNNLISDLIYPGQQLKISGLERPQYFVREGDTLFQLARQFDVTVNALKEFNNLTSDLILVEQPLIIPRQETELIANNLPIQDLGIGDKGEAIRRIQYALFLSGYNIQVDGIFGKQTSSIIKQFQQSRDITADGHYNDLTRIKLGNFLHGNDDIVSNFRDSLVLINKQQRLPHSYIPYDLTEPKIPFTFSEADPKKLVRQDAAVALEQLFEKAYQEDIELYGVSGYRAYARQEWIFIMNANNKGLSIANITSAKPGESEHQTGLAIDITCARVNYNLTTDFGNTTEGRWLQDNCYQFGFIIRYPQGKEQITGYSYEPWHIRYVGQEAATEIYNLNLTLEEYLHR